MKEDTKMLVAIVPIELNNKLMELCKKEVRSMSNLVRMILEEYVNKHKVEETEDYGQDE